MPTPSTDEPSPTHRSLVLEVRALFRLAGPIFLAQVASMGMAFEDTIMAGHVGAEDLAAVALGSSLWNPAFLFFGGLLFATTPLVAHRFGAQRFDAIGSLARQALWLALALGLVGAVVLRALGPLAGAFDAPPHVAALMEIYLEGVAWGFPAMTGYVALRGYSEGMGEVRPIMVIGIAALLLNLLANAVFIHGWFGVPAMGGAGCGAATGLVSWLSFAAMLVHVHRSRVYAAARLFERFEWPDWRRGADGAAGALVRLGVPIAVAIFAEVSIFAVIALLLGPAGEVVVAGHQVALNFASMMFMVPLSVALASTVRIGQARGRGDPGAAAWSARTAVGTALAFAIGSAALMACGADAIATLYTHDAAVVAVAAELLLFAALFQFSDAVQVTSAAGLRGYEDTAGPMVITVVAYWLLGMPVGVSLGLTDHWGPPMGARGLWIGLIVGLTAAAVMLAARLTRTAAKAYGSARASEIT